MIHLIYGKKGSGKSKKLLDMANAEAVNASGNIVYVDDNNRCMYDLKHEIRFVNTADYSIDTAQKLYGFICGILSGDFDISTIYIDGLKKMVKNEEEEDLVALLESFEEVFAQIDAYMVLSGSNTEPEQLKKYMIN